MSNNEPKSQRVSDSLRKLGRPVEHFGSNKENQSIAININPIEDDKKPPITFYTEDTRKKARVCREEIQEKNRQFGPIHTREHNVEDIKQSGDFLQNNPEDPLKSHPLLNNRQYLDGIDVNLNPQFITEADIENYKREKQRQVEELQNRLGNTPRFSNTPTPRPG